MSQSDLSPTQIIREYLEGCADFSAGFDEAKLVSVLREHGWVIIAESSVREWSVAAQGGDAENMREMAAKVIKARITPESGADWGLLPDLVRRQTRRQNDDLREIAAAIRALPLPTAAADQSEALRLAKRAIEGALPWVEAGPAGSWRDAVLARIEAALAALATINGAIK